MKLYPHQEKFLSEDPDYSILCWETGTGKSHIAKQWVSRSDRYPTAVVICPKQIKKDWEGITPFTFTFEEFKKAAVHNTLPSNPSAIIVDEADAMASPLFIPKKRSQRTEALYNYIMQNPDCHILLLTATPVRSSPWNMHTLLVLARIKPGTKESYLKYRSLYFQLEQRPYLPRPAWLPKPGWQKMMQELIDKYTYTALMSDIVDLPPETHDVIKLKPPKYEKNPEWEPMAQFVGDHRLEQESKAKEVTRLAKGYRKVICVVRYREQIDQLYKTLSKERETFVLDGRTKDVERTISDANASGECFLIIQSSVAAGFELPTFAVMIFVSMDFSVRNYVQMTGRIKRINALKPVKYYYLIGGKCDQAVYDNIQAGKDFVPSHYLQVV